MGRSRPPIASARADAHHLPYTQQSSHLLKISIDVDKCLVQDVDTIHAILIIIMIKKLHQSDEYECPYLS